MKERTIKIGVTYTGTDEKHSNYVHWLKGKDQVEITVLSPEHTGLENVHGFDGIVLSGGIDMHPKFYKNHNTNYPNAPDHFQEKRDAFEIEVFKISQQYQLPLLGVCRGMQLVNCVMGGTMTQDIGPVANVIHRYDQDDKAHGINVAPDSFLHEIMGLGRTVVNSAHHQSILELGEGLSINCTSDDGIIEGIEWSEKKEKSFFIGVQWHPERMHKLGLEQSPVTKNIRDRFINEMNKKKQ